MTRGSYLKLVAVVLVSAITAAPSAERAPEPKQPAINLSGAHGFDFLVGEWRVRHRRISAVSKKWVEFDGTFKLRVLMNGAANIEEHALESPDGAYRAIGLRSFDQKTGKWSIWWLDERYPGRPLDPPAQGSFDNGIGRFYAEYEQEGKPMIGRLQWSDITPKAAHWEQANSADGGKTWATNWIMDFTRVTEAPEPSQAAAGLAPEPAQAAAGPSGAHDFDFEVGEWRVQHRIMKADHDWMQIEGTTVDRPMMNGAASLEENTFNRADGVSHAIALRSYDRKTGEWSIWWLDSRYPSGPLDPPAKGSFVDGIGTFYGQDSVNGKLVPVRFTWSDITSTSARWQQGYSYDGGRLGRRTGPRSSNGLHMTHRWDGLNPTHSSQRELHATRSTNRHAAFRRYLRSLTNGALRPARPAPLGLCEYSVRAR
jgi:hypothetical protein